MGSDKLPSEGSSFRRNQFWSSNIDYETQLPMVALLEKERFAHKPVILVKISQKCIKIRTFGGERGMRPCPLDLVNQLQWQIQDSPNVVAST